MVMTGHEYATFLLYHSIFFRNGSGFYFIYLAKAIADFFLFVYT